MSASIRGHQGQIKLLKNGALVKIVNLTNVSINQDSTFSRSFYVGAPVPEGDQTIEGWSGSMDAEVKDDEMDLFIDALVNENLAGVGISDYVFVSSEQYPDGSVASYTYFDCQWKLSKTQGGLNTKTTKKLDFQASGRIRL
jgi:hypothetical protein